MVSTMRYVCVWHLNTNTKGLKDYFPLPLPPSNKHTHTNTHTPARPRARKEGELHQLPYIRLARDPGVEQGQGEERKEGAEEVER